VKKSKTYLEWFFLVVVFLKNFLLTSLAIYAWAGIVILTFYVGLLNLSQLFFYLGLAWFLLFLFSAALKCRLKVVRRRLSK